MRKDQRITSKKPCLRGTIGEVVEAGRSFAADRRRHAKRVAKSGQGDPGDRPCARPVVEGRTCALELSLWLRRLRRLRFRLFPLVALRLVLPFPLGHALPGFGNLEQALTTLLGNSG
jgi:hypothetical protein